MLTRSLYLAAGWFVLSLIATLAGGHRLRKGHPLISMIWLGLVILIGDAWAWLTFGQLDEIILFSGIAFAFGVLWITWLPHWNAFGQVTWAMTVLATLVFSLYSFMITAFT